MRKKVARCARITGVWAAHRPSEIGSPALHPERPDCDQACVKLGEVPLLRVAAFVVVRLPVVPTRGACRQNGGERDIARIAGATGCPIVGVTRSSP